MAPVSSTVRFPGMPAWSVRAARIVIATTLLASGVSGCKSLYLHSEAAQQATASAKTELDKVNLAAVFDNETAYLDELEKAENAAVAESLAALRDQDLLTMLRGRGDRDGRSVAASRVDGYLTTLTATSTLAGTSDRGGNVKLWRLIDDARQDVGGQKSFADALKEQLDKSRQQLKAPEGVAIPSLVSPSGLTLDEAIVAAQKSVKDIADKKAAAKAAQATLKDSIKKATDDLDAGNATQGTFTELLGKVNDLLADAKKKGTENPYLSELVSESVQDLLDHLIEVTDPEGIDTPQDTKARAAIGFVHAAFGVGDAFSHPPRVPHPNALAAAKAWLTYETSQAESQLALVQARDELARARLAAVAEQVYYLSHAGDALGGTFKPALSGGEGLTRLVEDKDPATSRAASAVLYYYAAAYSKGFIPAQQLNQVTGPLIDRRSKLEQSRQSGEAWLGTLKPAVATLVAYGEGGLDPHVFAELLQALGIGAIAVGVN